MLGAQSGQPLAGHRRRGADLGRQLGGVKPPAAGQLAAQVGVGDPVPHQPPPQLGQRRVAVALAAQHPQQVTGEPGCHADLAGEGGRVDRLAGVDLTLQPGVGDPLPGRPRISRPLLLGWSAGMLAGCTSRVIAGPLPAPARPPAPPPPGPARGPGGAGCA